MLSKKLSSKKLFLALPVVALLAFATSAPASVTIIDPDVGTSLGNTIFAGNVAGDRTTLVDGAITQGVAIPVSWSDPSDPTHHHANATFTFTDSKFSISNIDNARTGGFIAQEHARIAFTVDVPTKVTFSGQYINTNVADFSGRASMQNALSDNTNFTNPIPSSTVFSTSFAKGPVPLNIATQIGFLTPGHTYVWDVFVGSFASGNPAGSTGTGELDLSFAPTPEPANLTLVMLGVAAVGHFWRRRRQP